jgi:glycosyltransferase involved in cell wall biosynthesis
LTTPRPLRILSVQPVGDGGGSETALIQMIRRLTSAGWECHVAVPPPIRLADEYRGAGAKLHPLHMRHVTTSGGSSKWIGFALAWPPTVLKLARLIRAVDADVVHSNSLHTWYPWAAAAVTRRPHVWHAREIVFQSAAALRLERYLARRFATRVVAVSDAVADQLDPDNVEVVRDDADPDRFRPDRAGAFRAGAGIAEDVPLAGSVARIDTWKGHDVLLDAYPLIKRERPDVELVIAGGPVRGKEDYAARLQARADRMPGVHWLGPRRDVPELVADLDVFVQVSTESEPFGMVVVESLAAGVPVVAGAEGGPLEILGSGAADRAGPGGRLVAPGDAARLAAAVLEVLPPGPSSLARRRSRSPLRPPGADRFPALFSEVVGGRATRAGAAAR